MVRAYAQSSGWNVPFESEMIEAENYIVCIHHVSKCIKIETIKTLCIITKFCMHFSSYSQTQGRMMCHRLLLMCIHLSTNCDSLTLPLSWSAVGFRWKKLTAHQNIDRNIFVRPTVLMSTAWLMYYADISSFTRTNISISFWCISMFGMSSVVLSSIIGYSALNLTLIQVKQSCYSFEDGVVSVHKKHITVKHNQQEHTKNLSGTQNGAK